MELNNVLFPAPKFDFYYISHYEDELVFIPKSDSKPIPCLLLLDDNKRPSNNYLLLFHANAEDLISVRVVGDKLRKRLKMNVLIVEYPGYSLYNEDKSSETMLANTLVVYDFLIQNVKNLTDSNVYVFGRSIGTSPAIYLAGQRKVAALFIVSAFTTIKAVADNVVGFLSVFLSERFKSIDYIKTVQCPILMIHGQRDPMIPFEESQKLKKACCCPFEVFLPEDMTHNDFDLEKDVIKPIIDFLYRHNGTSNEPAPKFNFPFDKTQIPEDIKKKISDSLLG